MTAVTEVDAGDLYFTGHTFVTDEHGEHHAFTPGDAVPGWARARVGEHLLATGPVTADEHAPAPRAHEHPDPDVAFAPERPPTSGPGSGRAVWAAYAQALGEPTTTGMSRQDIIDALIRHGRITDGE